MRLWKENIVNASDIKFEERLFKKLSLDEAMRVPKSPILLELAAKNGWPVIEIKMPETKDLMF